MSHFLSRLVQHTLGEAATVRPAVPVVTAPDTTMAVWDERVIARDAPPLAAAAPSARTPLAAHAAPPSYDSPRAVAPFAAPLERQTAPDVVARRTRDDASPMAPTAAATAPTATPGEGAPAPALAASREVAAAPPVVSTVTARALLVTGAVAAPHPLPARDRGEGDRSPHPAKASGELRTTVAGAPPTGRPTSAGGRPAQAEGRPRDDGEGRDDDSAPVTAAARDVPPIDGPLARPEAPRVNPAREIVVTREGPRASSRGSDPDRLVTSRRPADVAAVPHGAHDRESPHLVQESTTVEVSIGRIEVRLPPAPRAQPAAAPAAQRRPAVGLGEYLRARDARRPR